MHDQHPTSEARGDTPCVGGCGRGTRQGTTWCGQCRRPGLAPVENGSHSQNVNGRAPERLHVAHEALPSPVAEHHQAPTQAPPWADLERARCPRLGVHGAHVWRSPRPPLVFEEFACDGRGELGPLTGERRMDDTVDGLLVVPRPDRRSSGLSWSSSVVAAWWSMRGAR